MVGGEEAERAVLHARADGGHVFAVAERRRHLPVRVVVGDVVAGEEQVVGRRLARDGQSLALGGADELDRARAGDVLHVEGAAGHAHERDVAPDGLGLRFGRHDG